MDITKQRAQQPTPAVEARKRLRDEISRTVANLRHTPATGSAGVKGKRSKD